ncbi:hypothetical protein ACFOHP_03705 [Couchioplanes caeruleus subsp. azureus]|uniref:hypothetical protein n=1 Tax=Couchioplanes caeruleus TaxID=56438 RepID=UPI003621BC84
MALPDHAGQKYGRGLLGVLMEPGTYAERPAPVGRPWRRGAEAAADDRHVFVTLREGPVDTVAVAPGDTRNTVLIPGRLDGDCCGLDGANGSNIACAGCRTPVATRIDDCGHWQVTWLDVRATRRIPERADTDPPTDWAVLRMRRTGLRLVEEPWGWHPLWEAAAGVALAHVLAASDGHPVTVPDGPVADVFRRSLETLLRADRKPRSLTLAGPGLPPTEGDLALVPRHPETGEVWRPAGPAVAVPLSYEAWHGLSFPQDRPLLAGAGVIPPEITGRERLPCGPFRPDGRLCGARLARLAEVRRPWLREIYERYQPLWLADPF